MSGDEKPGGMFHIPRWKMDQMEREIEARQMKADAQAEAIRMDWNRTQAMQQVGMGGP